MAQFWLAFWGVGRRRTEIKRGTKTVSRSPETTKLTCLESEENLGYESRQQLRKPI
jgi:hypothetical protein